jgi:hypothetical protein
VEEEGALFLGAGEWLPEFWATLGGGLVGEGERGVGVGCEWEGAWGEKWGSRGGGGGGVECRVG